MSTSTVEGRDKLIKRRIVPVTGEVNRALYDRVESFIGEFMLSGSPDIAIIINSNGGDVSDGLDIYDLVNLYPGVTTGLVFRQAASMAAVILQGCKTRLAARHADILIHHISRNRVSLDVLEDPSGEKLKTLHADMIKRQQHLYDILQQRTGKSLEEIKLVCQKDSPMTAEEAKAFGLIDEIATRDDLLKWFAPETARMAATT